MSNAPDRIRTLMVSAPEEEAGAARTALARSGHRIEAVLADDERALLRGLRTPLDLVLAWHRTVPTEKGARDGSSRPLSLSATVQLILRLGLQTPVVGMISPGDEDEFLIRLGPGVAGWVYRDRPAPLGAIARWIGGERRRRELVDLTRSTCHDLNNLLAPVPLATRILGEQLGPGEDVSFLDTVEGSVARATAAVGSLYRVALWAAGDTGPTAGPIRLKHLVEATARSAREAFPALVVETDYPPDLPSVDAPPDTLRRILQCVVLHVVAESEPSRSEEADRTGVRQTVRIAVEAASGRLPPDDDGREVSTVVVSVSGPSTDPGNGEHARVDGPLDLASLREEAALLGGTIEVFGASPAERAGLRLTLPGAGSTPPSPAGSRTA